MHKDSGKSINYQSIRVVGGSEEVVGQWKRQVQAGQRLSQDRELRLEQVGEPKHAQLALREVGIWFRTL